METKITEAESYDYRRPWLCKDIREDLILVNRFLYIDDGIPIESIEVVCW